MPDLTASRIGSPLRYGSPQRFSPQQRYGSPQRYGSSARLAATPEGGAALQLDLGALGSHTASLELASLPSSRGQLVSRGSSLGDRLFPPVRVAFPHKRCLFVAQASCCCPAVRSAGRAAARQGPGSILEFVDAAGGAIVDPGPDDTWYVDGQARPPYSSSARSSSVGLPSSSAQEQAEPLGVEELAWAEAGAFEEEESVAGRWWAAKEPAVLVAGPRLVHVPDLPPSELEAAAAAPAHRVVGGVSGRPHAVQLEHKQAGRRIVVNPEEDRRLKVEAEAARRQAVADAAAAAERQARLRAVREQAAREREQREREREHAQPKAEDIEALAAALRVAEEAYDAPPQSAEDEAAREARRAELLKAKLASPEFRNASAQQLAYIISRRHAASTAAAAAATAAGGEVQANAEAEEVEEQVLSAMPSVH